MARAKGFQGIIGFKKASTWGTAVACGALDGLEVVDLQPNANRQPIEDMQITGKVTQKESDAGNVVCAPTFRTALRYEGNERHIAHVLGQAGAPATVDTSAYQHDLHILDDVDGIFATIAYEFTKDTKVAEMPAVKCNRVTVRGRPGERVELEIGCIADNWKDDSGTNDTTSIDSVTLPSNREFVLMRQGTFEINDQDGADFGGSDYAKIASFELTIERPMEGRYTTTSGAYIEEPVPTGFVKVTGSIEFAHVEDGTGGNLAFLMEQLSLTRKKAKLTFTSPNLAGAATQYFQHVFWLPNLQFGEDGKVPIPGPGAQRHTMPFNAFHVDSIPTGFTAGYTGAVTWEIFSQLSTDPLA